MVYCELEKLQQIPIHILEEFQNSNLGHTENSLKAQKKYVRNFQKIIEMVEIEATQVHTRPFTKNLQNHKEILKID